MAIGSWRQRRRLIVMPETGAVCAGSRRGDSDVDPRLDREAAGLSVRCRWRPAHTPDGSIGDAVTLERCHDGDRRVSVATPFVTFGGSSTHPDGITVDDMMDENGWTTIRPTTRSGLRRFLGEYDSVNLPCEPQGEGERWKYRLVGRLDDVRGWVDNRIGDSESRLRTMAAVLSSIVAATDGRSIKGRRARIMEKALRRLVEDLDDLMADGSAT